MYEKEIGLHTSGFNSRLEKISSHDNILISLVQCLVCMRISKCGIRASFGDDSSRCSVQFSRCMSVRFRGCVETRERFPHKRNFRWKRHWTNGRTAAPATHRAGKSSLVAGTPSKKCRKNLREMRGEEKKVE